MDDEDNPITEETQETPAAELDPYEAEKVMQESKERKAEKIAQDIAEFEESRKSERLKEAAEIEALRQKREQRAKERIEEDKRLTEMRKQEEDRRRGEEKDIKRKKQEEERERKDEKERKKREAEERLKPKRPNYVITKKSGEIVEPEAPQKEDVQKSKEQLEEEKRAILAQRIHSLDVTGLSVEKLVEKAKELHDRIRHLISDKYDMDQKFKRQQYDMLELAERARQMNKGKKGAVQVEDTFDRLADKYIKSPPKIQLCSKFERHTDHRTYGQRLDLFEELSKEIEAIVIQHKNALADEDEVEVEEAEDEATVVE